MYFLDNPYLDNFKKHMISHISSRYLNDLVINSSVVIGSTVNR